MPFNFISLLCPTQSYVFHYSTNVLDTVSLILERTQSQKLEGAEREHELI